MHYMATRALLEKVMIEGDYSVHFGHREVEFPGNERYGILGYECKRLLYCMQDRQQRPGQRLQARAGIQYRRPLCGAQAGGRLGLDRYHSPGSLITHDTWHGYS